MCLAHEIVMPICGKNDMMLNHLIKCESVKEVDKKEAEEEEVTH